MTEFKVISTQEELNKVIQDRLARQKENYEKRLAELEAKANETEALTAKLEDQAKAIESFKAAAVDSDSKLADLHEKISNYELKDLKRRVALANGLSYALADRLVGDTEEALTADAQSLLTFVNATAPLAPLKDNEPKLGGQDEAFKGLLKNLEQ